MKKILYIFGIFALLSTIISMLGSSLVSNIVWAQSNTTSSTSQDENCDKQDSYAESEACLPWSQARILNKLNPFKKDLSFTTIFSTNDPKSVGKDLYEVIYYQTLNKPKEDAAKNIAGKYGVTESEAAAMIHGSIQPILKRKPTLTHEEALSKINEIQQQFEEEQRILKLQAEIETATMPSEMFANGDVTDSGFDLIEDLRLIEELLFLKSEPITVGQTYQKDEDEVGQAAGNLSNPTNASNTNVNINSSVNTGSQSGSSASQTAGSSGSQVGNSQDPQGSEQNSSSQNTATAQQNLSQENTFNPNICFATTNLENALKDFQTNKIQDIKYKDNSLNQGSSGQMSSSSSGQSGSSSSGQSNSGSAGEADGTNGNSENVNQALLPLASGRQENPTPAKPGTWLKNPPCTDVFCLSVNFVTETAESYQLTDNCIACHLEKINASLKKTINYNLTPSKVTGNVMEASICKKAAFNAFNDIGLNFYAIAQPVSTPTNDDIIYGTSIFDEWNRFIAQSKPFPFGEKEILEQTRQTQPTTVSENPMVGELERTVKVVLSESPSGTALDEVTKAINDEIAARRIERQTATKIAEVSVKSDNDSGFYQGTIRELDQMNYYFTYFQNILKSLHEQVEGISGRQACVDLKNKKQCE